MNHPAARHLDIEAFLADIRNPAYNMTHVDGRMTLSERFNTIRANYRARARMVADGKCDWNRGDPYRIADWPSIFTPIEAAAWGEIRGDGLPLWPQFPVGRYFVDFGNPDVRIVLECDGKSFHDPKKDAQRDAELLEMGWTVYRAPGWKCMKDMTPPCELDEEDASAEYRAEYRDTTIRGLIQLIARNHFPERAYLEQ